MEIANVMPSLLVINAILLPLILIQIFMWEIMMEMIIEYISINIIITPPAHILPMLTEGEAQTTRGRRFGGIKH